jgi:hypothetical protein
MRLLSDIQGKFKKTYSGTYLAVILAELFRQDAAAFTQVLAKAGIKYAKRDGDKVVANSWQFPSIIKHRRFADLAVIDAGEKPLVLVEIKDADINNDQNTAQLNDYLAFIDKKDNRRVQFLFLSRSAPPEKDEIKLRHAKSKKRVRSMLFGQLYEPLRQGGTFASMIRDYLEDIEVVYHDQIPPAKTIQYVTGLIFNRRGQTANNKSIPKFFDTVFSNLGSIGGWLENNNTHLFKQEFKRRIYVEPWHDVRAVQAALQNERKSRALLDDDSLHDFCYGGEVDFFASGHLRSGKSVIRLEFGYWSTVSNKSKKRNNFSHGVYANIQWKPWNLVEGQDLIEGYDELKSFPTEEEFQKKLRGFLQAARKTALSSKACPPDIKRLLKRFEIA